MNALAEEGFLLFGGPLAGSEEGRLRALLIVSAASDDEIRRRLADDPWTRADRLVIAGIEPWKVFTGAERLPSNGPGPTAATQPRASGRASTSRQGPERTGRPPSTG
jgi:uncharacterized protein YciI